MAMVRKQIYITEKQDKKLKQAAERLSTTEADIVRRGIELMTQEETLSRAEAWAEELAFMKERAKIKVPYAPRTWTREELYDD
jgi:hypothetical protein